MTDNDVIDFEKTSTNPKSMKSWNIVKYMNILFVWDWLLQCVKVYSHCLLCGKILPACHCIKLSLLACYASVIIIVIYIASLPVYKDDSLNIAIAIDKGGWSRGQSRRHLCAMALMLQIAAIALTHTIYSSYSVAGEPRRYKVPVWPLRAIQRGFQIHHGPEVIKWME